MVNKVDFQNLRGAFSKAMVSFQPKLDQARKVKLLERFDEMVKPLVGNYDEVDLMVKVTYKNLKGELKVMNYRPIQKPIEIPEDVVRFATTVKLVIKKSSIELATAEKLPFYSSPNLYIEENLTARQLEQLKAKIKKQETIATTAKMEEISEIGGNYIKFKPANLLEI